MAEYKEDDLSKLIRLSYVVAKPWRICTWLLVILLAGSLYINYQLSVNGGPIITFGADNNNESNIEQTNNK